jgi:hypothetical protein
LIFRLSCRFGGEVTRVRPRKRLLSEEFVVA